MKSRVAKRDPFKEVIRRLDGVFDVYEHVKGKEERQVAEEDVYKLLVDLILLVNGVLDITVEEVSH